MSYRIPIKTALVFVVLSTSTSQFFLGRQSPIQVALDAATGGDIVGGLQLRLAPAVGAEQKAARDFVMRLALQVRNGGQVPVIIDKSKISGQVEFEVDNIWYRESTPTRNTGLLTVAPGGQGLILLTFSITDAYRYHGLNAIDANGAGGRLNLREGKHSIRVRTPLSTLQSSASPGISLVSNAITVDIPAMAPPPVASSQSVRKPDISSFRFAAGPTGGIEVANDFLIHPSTNLLAAIPKLADFDALRVLPPLPFNDFSLPETPQTVAGAAAAGPTPSLPTQTELYSYLVEAEGQGIAAIVVHANKSGRTELWTPNPDTNEVVLALGQLATMERIRTGNYEPRLLRVGGRAGTLLVMVLWLKSASGNADLFYKLINPDPRISSSLLPETLYTKEEFLKLASTHSVPMKDAAWAIQTVTVCAANARAVGGSPLVFDKATAVPWEGTDGVLQWLVNIPEQSARSIPSGAAFLVNETTGVCTVFLRE